MRAADSSAYARQLGDALSLLRFEQPLEREFCAFYSARGIPVVRMALIIGLVFIGGMSLLDWRLHPGEFAARSAVLRLGFMAPMIVMSLVSAYPGRLARFANTLLLSTGAVISGGSVMLLWLAQEYSVTPAYTGVTVITIFLYLMLGLRLFPTLWLTLPLLGGFLFVSGILAEPTAHFYYDSLFLIMINVVAALTCYRLEHLARTIFLERGIANTIAATDGLTGIPNRKIFNTHLQSVRRQAQRESCSLAVALVEFDYLEAFRNRYGQQAADACLRRVAHAVMRSARRPLDFAARFSNEAFAIVLYDPDPRYLEQTIGLVQENVAMLDIPHEVSPVSERVTASIGIAISPRGSRHRIRRLLQAADEALKECRSQGGDGLVVTDTSRVATDGRVLIGPWQFSANE